jgi:hypothetical protein
MSQRTDLATGLVNSSDRLTIELVEHPNSPAFIQISWPEAPTVCSPTQFDKLVARTMRILSNGVIELAAIRVNRHV